MAPQITSIYPLILQKTQTFKQVKAKGGNIKKGSTGLPVIYWSTFEREDQEAKDNVRHIPFYTLSPTCSSSFRIMGIKLLE